MRLKCACCRFGMYGGEGGIRTPDTLASMPDFESGAFNRALPPLRCIYNMLPDLRCTLEDHRLEKGVQRSSAPQQPRLQNSQRVRAGSQEGELWKRRRLRVLGKRLRRFPLCHSSGYGLNWYDQPRGFWGQVTTMRGAPTAAKGVPNWEDVGEILE